MGIMFDHVSHAVGSSSSRSSIHVFDLDQLCIFVGT